VSTAIAPQEFFVLSESEEAPMTMQVGMVGTNGIVLASDRRWNMKSLLAGQTWGTAEHSLGSSKIKIDEARGIAISCAADLIHARTLADRILAALKDQNVEHPATVIKDVASTMIPSSTAPNPPQCLLVFEGPPPRLFYAFYISSSNGTVVPECLELDDVGIAGHTTNAALYWAERYSRFIPKMPIEKLIPLAAHLIVSAGIINPGGINGLEITYCDATGFHRLSKEENREWESKAEGWDKRIEKMIFGRSAL
jgi:hypothetical protein